MNTFTRILLVVAIVVVAVIGIGFGLCGVVGLTMGLTNRGLGGDVLFVVFCGVSGIGIAIGAGILIYTTLWKALRRKDPE
jgi:hypothetical protein